MPKSKKYFTKDLEKEYLRSLLLYSVIDRNYFEKTFNISKRNSLYQIEFLEIIRKFYEDRSKKIHALTDDKYKYQDRFNAKVMSLDKNFIFETSSPVLELYKTKSFTNTLINNNMFILRFLNMYEHQNKKFKKSDINKAYQSLYDNIKETTNQKELIDNKTKESTVSQSTLNRVFKSLIDFNFVNKKPLKSVDKLETLDVNINYLKAFVNLNSFKSLTGLCGFFLLENLNNYSLPNNNKSLDYNTNNQFVSSKHFHHHSLIDNDVLIKLTEFINHIYDNNKYISLKTNDIDICILPLYLIKDHLYGNTYLLYYNKNNNHVQTINIRYIKDLKLCKKDIDEDINLIRDFALQVYNKSFGTNINYEFDKTIETTNVQADFYINKDKEYYILNRLKKECQFASIKVFEEIDEELNIDARVHLNINVLDPLSMLNWFNSFTGYVVIRKSKEHNLAQIQLNEVEELHDVYK